MITWHLKNDWQGVWVAHTEHYTARVEISYSLAAINWRVWETGNLSCLRTLAHGSISYRLVAVGSETLWAKKQAEFALTELENSHMGEV